MKTGIITIILAFIVSASFAQVKLAEIPETRSGEKHMVIFHATYMDSTYRVTDTSYSIDSDSKKPLRTIMSRFDTYDRKHMVLAVTDIYDERTRDFYFYSATLEQDKMYLIPASTIGNWTITPNTGEYYLTNPPQFHKPDKRKK